MGGSWRFVPLGIDLPAPPPTIDAGSTADDIELATVVLGLGMASARWDTATPLGVVRCELTIAVKPSRALVLATGRVAAGAAVAREFFRVLAGPWAVVGLLWVTGLVLALPPLAVVAACLGVVLALVLVHELGHVLVYRHVRPHAVGIFVMSRHSPRLVRPPLPRWTDVAVTAAGPAGAVLAAACVAVAAGPGQPVVMGVTLVAALGHLLGLVLPVGDGVALRAALRAPARATAVDRPD